MPTIKSIEDLKRVREEALQKRQIKNEPGHVQIVVGMGTPGIAAGARETMKTILDIIEKENLSQIMVRQTGNIGIDSFEPIIQVIVGDQPAVTYGKVTPEAARKIMQQHVIGGQVVKEYVIS
jgi:NADP-reducing hydrogenase subunit HndB